MTDTSRHAEFLATAVAAAQAAGALIREAAADRSTLDIRAKRPNDFVTQVDTACERAIAQTLLAAFPGHAVRGEESAAGYGDAAADHVWIVDPLDGTNNFIHGFPWYAVSIALAVRGRVEVGVVLDVPHGECFTAMRDGGAFCNGQRLAVSTRATLAQAIVAASCPLPRGEGFEAALRVLGLMLSQASALRRCGAAALDLAQVAAGRSDAYFDRGLNAWDVAAGGLLVQEAGGRVTTYAGESGFMEARECLAANPALHAVMSGILASIAAPR
jgi:myo-inositol-1(or 4)-monophosphatase